ncbi:hydrolase [Flexivirga endophytica]|uniref:Hydrolase n=1 Tax=Flexivirga endophytica TaxID=1849103 RepID=A0A916WY42_9MICO|nr:HAD hydrolase-like protein [Flexivirga endophytica]GGB42890.1 hydrolase [Flexivirga endophytica]GHB64411.1 hydrolase [Flexivirga endophytica]
MYDAVYDADRLVVGFDLDMTLVDSRQGIVDCMQRTLRTRGVTATEQQLWPLIGAPLLDNLALFLPDDQVEDAATDYRADYLVQAIEVTVLLPGARDLVDAIHAAGGKVLVVSAKNPAAVQAVLEHVGITPDIVVGDLFGHDKAGPLSEHHATAYIGDHSGDMHAAGTAGVRAVGVTTGPTDAAALLAAGADVVVDDLAELVPRLADLAAGAPAAK